MSIRALVVGGTGGTGYALATRLASEPTTASVIISGRNKPSSLPHVNMHFRALDASSMRSIKTYTDAFKASEKEKLDYLILTQGVFTMDGRVETPEGIDRKMALHYYGRQMLIRELLPVLQPDAKVITLLDSVNGNPDKLNWNDLDLKTTFSLANAGQHCLNLNDAMVQHWATTQGPGEKRHFIHAYPSVVATAIGSGLPWYMRVPMKALQSVVGAKPDVWAQRFWTGLPTGLEEGNKEGKLYHYVNEKGLAAKNKKQWSEDQLRTITEHTWGLVDTAVATKQ